MVDDEYDYYCRRSNPPALAAPRHAKTKRVGISSGAGLGGEAAQGLLTTFRAGHRHVRPCCAQVQDLAAKSNGKQQLVQIPQISAKYNPHPMRSTRIPAANEGTRPPSKNNCHSPRGVHRRATRRHGFCLLNLLHSGPSVGRPEKEAAWMGPADSREG